MTNCKSPLGPPWLIPFLTAHYFSRCFVHGLERNHFCIDCLSGPLCPSGVKLHSGHRTLQVRKASHFDSVRIADIQKLVDISAIQTYSINNARIVFLVERPRCREHSKKEPKDWAKVCLSCDRNLVDPASYCSIGCKLFGITERLDNFTLSLAGALGKSSTEAVPMDQSSSCELRKEVALPAYNCCELRNGEGEIDCPPIPKKRRGNATETHHGTGKFLADFELCMQEAGIRSLREIRTRDGPRRCNSAQEGPPAPETPPRRQSVSASLRRASHRRKGTPHRAPFL